MRKVLLLVAMLGAMACGGEKTPAAAAVGDAAVDSAQSDSATDAAVDAPEAAQDSAEVAVDVPEVSLDSPHTAWCKSYYDRMLVQWLACGCDAGAQKSFLSDCAGQFGGSLEEPSVKGEVALDTAMDSTCTASFAAVGKGCSGQAFTQALEACRLTWFDTAKIGEPCHAAGPMACGAGQGLCVVVQPPDGYKCFAAGSQGDSCSATQPCRADLACLEGSLTRAKTCGMPGSTCNLSDKCRQGFKCESGACKADPSAPKSMCKP